MDVLKPETYWINSRCYRKNPSRNGGISGTNETWNEKPENNYNGSGTLKPYVEDEDEALCDPDAPDELEDIGKYLIEPIENGFKSKCDNIPSSLFPHIVGSKGTTKKRIEYETNTRIIVPRPNEKGDIVIRGQKEKDVITARRRLELIASQSRFKRDATHFPCFPLNSPNAIDKMKEFKEKVLQECGTRVRGLDDLLFNDAEKMHLTICVLVLLDEKERNLAADMLQKLGEEIKRDYIKGAKLRINLKGIEIMNDDPTQVDVLYAKCSAATQEGTDLFQQIADLVAKRFIESGFAKENRGEKVKLHCTVMNSRIKAERKANNMGDGNNQVDEGGNRSNSKMISNYNKRDSFDASLILSKFKDFDFGVVEIKEMKLATRHTTGTDGFYKAYSSISL